MTLDQYLSRVLPHVPGCSYPLAQQAVVDAADEFCRESRVLLERQEPVSIAAGANSIDIDPTIRDTVFFDVAYVRLDDDLLAPIEPQDAPTDNRGTPQWYWPDPESGLRISPATNRQMLASIGLILTVKPTASSIPAELDRWREGIVAGALFRLQRTETMPWYIQGAAAAWHGVFVQEIGRAKAESTLGGGKRTLLAQICP